MRSVLRVLVLGCLAACGGASNSPTTATATQVGAEKPGTPRAELPAAIQPLLPKNGIYIAGGGLMSPAWRIVVDIDANTIFTGTNDNGNTSSTGPMDHEATRDLSARNKNHLMQMAYAAWSEPPPAKPDDMVDDYDEIFVVLEGDHTFFLEGFGPVRRPLAAQAIVEVRAAAGL